MRFATSCALILLASPALAMLPPCAYDDLVREADTVVQIAGIRVSAPVAYPTDCMIEGTVAHVLAGSVAPGTPLTVRVACEWDGAVGGTIYHDRAALQAAELIELHLTRGEVAGFGAGLDIVPPKAAGRMVHVFECAGGESD